MSYTDEITVIQNDYGYNLQFRLKDASGNAVDLTGADTVKLLIYERNSSTAKIVGTCTVLDASSGTFQYTVQEGDFSEAPKTYLAEVEVTWPTKVISATGVTIRVRPEAPETTS